MAQKRMIDKKISVSEQVSDLPIQSQLLFTWCIPHTDDIGLLPFSLKTLKALVVPMQDWSLEEFTGYWRKIVSSGLVMEFEHEGRKYWRVAKFFEFQKLRKDIQPYTILPIQLSKVVKNSWSILYKIVKSKNIDIDTDSTNDGTDTERHVYATSTKDKIREDKIREDNLVESKEISAPTPKQIAIEFFRQVRLLKESGEEDVSKEATELLDRIHSLQEKYKVPYEPLWKEINKFASYWTEPNKNGSKQRWEMQETFEVGRRLSTWFGNIKTFNAPQQNKGRDIIR